MSSWILEDEEKEALAGAQKRHLRDTVVEHALSKLRLPQEADIYRMRPVMDDAHEAAARILDGYPDASYRSYVFLTLIYAILGRDAMATPEPWVWLGNDRIGINCRVDLAYRITKDAVNRVI